MAHFINDPNLHGSQNAPRARQCRHALTALLLCGLFLSSLAVTGCDEQVPKPGDQTITVDIAGEPFTLELALTQAQRFKGLSGRQDIAKDGGMLFVFTDAAKRYFVMRDCLVPIDIVFIAPGGRIVKMHEMQVEPLDTPEHELVRYDSQWPAQFVIELKAGSIERLALKPGQKLELPWRELAQLAQ